MLHEGTTLIGTLTLGGEGQVIARPDIATVQLGVQTRAKTAREAVSENANRMAAVIAAIKGLGIPKEDLQTVAFQISPVMDWKEGSPTHGQVIEYEVHESLNVVSSVEDAGAVLDRGVDSGANLASGLTFGVREDGALRKQALINAVQSANTQANLLCKEMGVTLRGVKSVEVTYGGVPRIEKSLRMEARSVPVEPGTLTISASIQVVYEYRN